VVKVLSGRVDVPGLHPSLRDFLSVLVTGLDVRIFYESDLCPRTCVHDPAAMDTSVFLKKLSLAKYQNDRVTVESYIDGNHCRLRKLEIDGRILGVAALSTIVDTARYRLGLRTVGGLAASVHAGYAQEFIGYLNYTPGSAKRETDKIEAAPACLQNWYGEQLELLTASSFGDFERCVVASNACGLGFDPLPFGRLLLVRPTGQQIFLSYEQVAEMAATTPIVIFKSKAMDHAETYHRNAVHHEYPLIQPLVNSGYLSLEFNGDCPKSAYSIIGCLDRAVRLLNRIPKWTLRNSIHQGTFGSMDELLLNTVASG
jgi:hypothetical protein